MKGVCGYGRYNDDPEYVGCPRAKSDMTPCIARDGRVALADDLTCVGCGTKPHLRLTELREAGVPILMPTNVQVAADLLRAMVRNATEGLGSEPGDRAVG